ncbi:hypothetical protein JWG45_08370 [Leptospira sp. 201903070]|uniref:Uncharacterized protein n=1 Tax=Leptospira ainlahdjerensis TaxID=2810033 RepID=A0ABS2UAG9_9LEPT|nr:hypothetical protein [Leptospira ainlahdjerensis]MBM9577164.1 hypothetical protein [Leptospira ainlahdjerensis]
MKTVEPHPDLWVIILPTSSLDLQGICGNSDKSTVKVASPTHISGGGAGGGKSPETFLYHKIRLFASKNFFVEVPTKRFPIDDHSRSSSQTCGYGCASGVGVKWWEDSGDFSL